MAVKLMKSAGCLGLRVKILSRVLKQCTVACKRMRVTRMIRMIRLIEMIKVIRMMKTLKKIIQLPAASLTLSLKKTR